VELLDLRSRNFSEGGREFAIGSGAESRTVAGAAAWSNGEISLLFEHGEPELQGYSSVRLETHEQTRAK